MSRYSLCHGTWGDCRSAVRLAIKRKRRKGKWWRQCDSVKNRFLVLPLPLNKHYGLNWPSNLPIRIAPSPNDKEPDEATGKGSGMDKVCLAPQSFQIWLVPVAALAVVIE